MNEKEYRKQTYKVYGSFSLSIVWLVALFTLTRMFPGTFQEQKLIGKIAILILFASGIGYVIFLIKFLSSKKTIKCFNYYFNKEKKKR
ncbi:hypothetical protein OXPF_06900 [Oxobacter pfennigii]|uniref:Uncharacterized protein n=1 Tax=Oxobacter pfennigii TaxID=36849 RepID=A0A0P8WSA1_9CLOT|nr:hypothetical protein [Oxobacter pfennigii]KPU45457.1 hypothetical protein OXPF_06900 [Oxobacter pfennigii]